MHMSFTFLKLQVEALIDTLTHEKCCTLVACTEVQKDKSANVDNQQYLKFNSRQSPTMAF